MMFNNSNNHIKGNKINQNAKRSNVEWTNNQLTIQSIITAHSYLSHSSSIKES